MADEAHVEGIPGVEALVKMGADSQFGRARDAREDKEKLIAEARAVMDLARQAAEDAKRATEERDRALEEAFGLLWEAAGTVEDAERFEFIEKVLVDLEAMPDTTHEGREDGRGEAAG